MGLFGPPNIQALKEKGNLKGLIKALRYKKDHYVRMNAAIALGEIADAKAVGALTKSIDDEKPSVQKFALKALGQIGNPEAVEVLITQVGSDQAANRNVAEDALAELGEPAVRPLISALKSSKPQQRWMAAKILGKIEVDEAVTPLINALQDRNAEVRRWSVFALTMIGDAKATVPLIPLVNDPDSMVQDAAIKALGQFGDPKVIEALTSQLKHQDEEIRKQIVHGLDQVKWQPGKDEIGAWYWSVKGNWRKCKTIGQPAVEPLLVALTSSDDEIRKAAVIALGHIGDERAIEPLIAAQDDKQIVVQRAAVKALGQIGGNRAARALVTSYGANDGKNLQTNIFNALRDIGPPARKQYIAILKKIALKDPLWAYKAVRQIEDQDALSFLISTLHTQRSNKAGFRKVLKVIAKLYKSGDLNDSQKQRILQLKKALHWKESTRKHMDHGCAPPFHGDSYRHTDSHIDFYDMI